MAPRTLSRRALREQNDQVEKIEKETTKTDDDIEAPEPKVKKTRTRKAASAKPVKEKAPAKPRARKRAVKVPARMIARWAVCDGTLKRLAIFEYKDRAGADAKLLQMQEQKKGPFILQLIKEPYDPPAVAVEPVAAV